MADPTANAHVEVAAAPELVYRLITDLDTLARLSGELEGGEWIDEAGSPEQGMRFRGANRNGDKTWTTVATVRAAERGRRFAFDVDDADTPVSHWEYELRSTEQGCVVTERTWDRRPSWYTSVSAEVTGEADRDAANQRNIEATLRALKLEAERQ
ncbi:uncharacterized protein YndB with AHSA1/START domain [Saccharopolyspora lacisalsi]|uniref:Uncharacterized protein YndB with AHSA1/START domain n=1 Tax=Halosaccharopolyspora lacisalsi TaxID=1000566 RepID=A0A839E3Q6_9PSEU|nr:SRPBCC family protein [Halosaccharopolyspora lacisalsi]MBA8826011.1 uncharacterized protein YndB with AHSA1/START domain [Halosaccharopolyspora lacisalsi]